MDKLTAEKLISKTRDDYNLIADQFASTRKFNWGDFAAALTSIPLKEGAKVLDLGCGNGRVYELFDAAKKIEYYGLDLSKELIKYAKAKVPNGHFVVSNLLSTPFKDDDFDLVVSAATLHHIPSKESREDAIKEIYRIVRPGGYILITNWYFWNKPFYVRRIIQSFWAQLRGLSKLEPGDFFMAWRDGSSKIITKRYFHAWRKAELKNILKRAGFEIVRVSLFFKRDKKVGNNLIAIARKPK